MFMTRRGALTLGLIATIGLGAAWLVCRPALAQLKALPVQADTLPPETKPPKNGGGGASEYSGVKLSENASFRQYLNVARDCIKDKAWQDAVTALQTILDNKEDFYAQVNEAGPGGVKVQRWTSVKFEANNLLGSMPAEGLDVYEQRFGAAARNYLADAKTTSNRELLAEVAQRYLHTKAGIEATDLLATHFLDRGQFFMAALRFEKLLQMNPERVKIDDLTLFKAALAYRRAGAGKRADAVWRKLESRMRDAGGLRIGGDVMPVAKLQKFMDETARLTSASPFDWPYVRGNLSNSAQAQGSPPLLDVVLFRRDTVKEKADDGEDEKGIEAKTRIEAAIAQQTAAGRPVLPGFFPIASNNLLVYRSYHDVRAVYLRDEKDAKGEVSRAGSIAWKTTDFDGALANVLAGSTLSPTIGRWLNDYARDPDARGLVYDNTLIGTLSTDHRNVYAIDDLAVPAPASQLQPFTWANGQQLGQDVKPLVLQNTLYAFNLRLGNCLWRLGGGPKDDPFADSHFLGAPINVGGKLYALNEKNTGPTGKSELRLVCIDPYKMAGPGRPTVIEPIQHLGDVLLADRVTHNESRRLNAVHLGYGEGILVCPTHAGEVLGVDLLSRSLAWAYPYREQMPASVASIQVAQPGLGLRAPQVYGNAASVKSNWQSAPPVIQDGKVVFTAPDANSIHCIHLRDGTPVWKKKQSENDLYLAGVFGGKVLVVGKTSVRALSLDDGRQLWQVATGDLPSGQGVASKDVYYLPLKKGEIMALDIDKGQVKAHNRARTAGLAPGNLIFYEGAVISQTPTQIVAYPQLEARLHLAQAALKAEPTNPDKLVERGELLLADGQVQGAVDDLHKALAKKLPEPLKERARFKLYEALSDLLAADFVGTSARYLEEYRELCNVPDNPREQQLRQARYFRIVGQGREAQGNLVEAFRMYREFGSLPIHREEGGIASLDDPTHKVPTGVWLRGRVGGMIAKATPEQKRPLEVKIAEEWKAVEAKKDPDAIRSFVGMFDAAFAVGREARLRLAEIIVARGDTPNFLEAELCLYQVRGAYHNTDTQSGGRALAALAGLEEKKGTGPSLRLAAAYYRELGRTFGNVPVPTDRDGNRTGAELLKSLATDPRFRPYLDEPVSPWGDGKIACREIPGGTVSDSLQGFVFQPEGELTPLMKQCRLILDTGSLNKVIKPNPELRLLDLSTNTIRWSQPLSSTLTPQYSQFLSQQVHNAYAANAKFRFYQVIGNLLVFQLGDTVYCLDADTAKLLWQQSLIDQNIFNQQGRPAQTIQQVVSDQDGYLDMVIWNPINNQRSHRPIGHVGSVQASYVALVTQKGLMVLDPLRGTPLWKKTDVSASTRVFGDESFLYLVETSDGSAGSGRILRASDGVEVPAPDFGGIYQSRVKVLGRRLLAAVPSHDKLVLKLYDVRLGKDVWSKAFDPRAVVLHTEDPSLTGVIDSDGRLSALDVNTGQELVRASLLHGRVTAEGLKGLKDPLLLQDEDRYYVVLNKPVDTAKVMGGILTSNFSNGVRCATVNGWLVALHRRAGQRASGGKTVSWQAGEFDWHSYAPLPNQMIVLEQFAELPVILLSSRYNEMMNGAVANRLAITQSINKRTGKMIYDPGSKTSSSASQFSSFVVDLRGRTVNMIGSQGAIQHYIEDGRKPADPPGLNVGATPGGTGVSGGRGPVLMEGNIRFNPMVPGIGNNQLQGTIIVAPPLNK